MKLKRRRREKGLILIASKMKQLRPFLGPLNRDMRKTLKKSWPGPITWVLPAAAHCPDWLTGGTSTLAVRVSDHPVCRALCDYWQGPLVSTSANVSGHPPIKRRLLLLKHLGGRIDYVVPGELGNLKKPTEIRDMLNKTIIRPA
jgi:L-threonylcarbamoyladenylate synthase